MRMPLYAPTMPAQRPKAMMRLLFSSLRHSQSMSRIFLRRASCSSFLLCGCFLMVCEKMKYVLLGMKSCAGISFTPSRMSQSDKSSRSKMPWLRYSSSV